MRFQLKYTRTCSPHLADGKHCDCMPVRNRNARTMQVVFALQEVFVLDVWSKVRGEECLMASVDVCWHIQAAGPVDARDLCVLRWQIVVPLDATTDAGLYHTRKINLTVSWRGAKRTRDSTNWLTSSRAHCRVGRGWRRLSPSDIDSSLINLAPADRDATDSHVVAGSQPIALAATAVEIRTMARM